MLYLSGTRHSPEARIMNRIKLVSLIFRVFFQLVFVGYIATEIIGWAYAPMNNPLFNVIPKDYQTSILFPLSLSDKIACFTITMIPTVVMLFIFYNLIKLLSLYEKSEFFSEQNVRHIKNCGYLLFLSQMVNPFCTFALGFILTAYNPPGLRYASMSLTEWNLGLILTSVIIILMSWIMAEGVKLQNEQQLTV